MAAGNGSSKQFVFCNYAFPFAAVVGSMLESQLNSLAWKVELDSKPNNAFNAKVFHLSQCWNDKSYSDTLENICAWANDAWADVVPPASESSMYGSYAVQGSPTAFKNYAEMNVKLDQLFVRSWTAPTTTHVSASPGPSEPVTKKKPPTLQPKVVAKGSVAKASVASQPPGLNELKDQLKDNDVRGQKRKVELPKGPLPVT